MSSKAPEIVANLLAELDRLGIHFEAAGEHFRFHPREAVSADLVARLKAHKSELLAAVRKREVDRRIDEQLAQLVPHLTTGGWTVWIHPDHRGWLERQGLLLSEFY